MFEKEMSCDFSTKYQLGQWSDISKVYDVLSNFPRNRPVIKNKVTLFYTFSNKFKNFLLEFFLNKFYIFCCFLGQKYSKIQSGF